MCIKQRWSVVLGMLQEQQKNSLWDILQHLAKELPTAVSMRLLEHFKYELSRFEGVEIDALCQGVIFGSKFPLVTAIRLAGDFWVFVFFFFFFSSVCANVSVFCLKKKKKQQTIKKTTKKPIIFVCGVLCKIKSKKRKLKKMDKFVCVLYRLYEWSCGKRFKSK